MAIVNTFAKCLESPYLVRDPDAPGRVEGLLGSAADRLEAAAGLIESGRTDDSDASFLAYEAMFACLRALVYRCGYREYGLKCLLLACEALYVKSGQLDPSHLRDLVRAQGLKDSPEVLLGMATGFVRRSVELMGKPVPEAGLTRP